MDSDNVHGQSIYDMLLLYSTGMAPSDNSCYWAVRRLDHTKNADDDDDFSLSSKPLFPLQLYAYHCHYEASRPALKLSSGQI